MSGSIQFCVKCGEQVSYRIPALDNRTRAICTVCEYIQYENPRVVVGAVCMIEQQTLMCKRAIEPRSGYWTIPAGFLEIAESTSAGAIREAKEEALADIEIVRLLAIFNIPRVAQVQMIYLANIKNNTFGVGEETAEVNLCNFSDALKMDIAFPNVKDALIHAQKIVEKNEDLPILEMTYD